MISYCSLTGTRSTVEKIRQSGWGFLVTPDTKSPIPPGVRLAIDNGAWGAFSGKREWSAEAFADLCDRRMVGRAVDWCVVPDVVGDAAASWARTIEWLGYCMARFPVVLIAVQDGMEQWPWLRDMLSDRVGVFVGGSTEWKLGTLAMWAAMARERGAWCHVGRVNSAKRIKTCSVAGVTSVDGNSVVLFPCTHARLDAAIRQDALPLW